MGNKKLYEYIVIGEKKRGKIAFEMGRYSISTKLAVTTDMEWQFTPRISSSYKIFRDDVSTEVVIAIQYDIILML